MTSTKADSTASTVQAHGNCKPDFPVAILKRLDGFNQEYPIIHLESPEVTVGRGKENTFLIADLLVSRRHAIFRLNKDNVWTVETVGMNGTSVNQVALPKNQPVPLNHNDVIEFGAGAKFVYVFRLQSMEGTSVASTRDPSNPPPNKMRVRLSQRNQQPSIKESPEAFKNWFQSRKTIERTLLEESLVLDKKLEEQSSIKDNLLLEQQRLEEHSKKVRLELEARFAEEKAELEKKGELEKSELLREKQALEEKMATILKAFQDECTRKTSELAESVEKANAEKKALLEQKEMIVRQLTREKQILEENLENERRLKAEAAAAQAQAEAELSTIREAFRRLVEEKQQLQQKGNEDEARMRVVEEALEAKQREIEDFQSQHAIGLEFYEAMQAMASTPAGGTEGDVTAAIELREANNGAPAATEVDVAAEVERRLQERMRQYADKMESAYECNICSELIVTAMLLNCNHVFCQYCLNQWKRNKRECPVCRTQITSESRFPFIDNAIESMISQLSEESQIKRKELVSQRAELVKRQVAEAVVEAANRRAAADHTHYVAQINAAAAPRLPHVPITVGTTSTRGGRRTARRPDPVLPAQPTYIMNPVVQQRLPVAPTVAAPIAVASVGLATVRGPAGTIPVMVTARPPPALHAPRAQNQRQMQSRASHPGPAVNAPYVVGSHQPHVSYRR